ncbi:MAG: four helix bundle protein [Bacteroidales bacterium]|nr:four helix bundle protein [Bacteroidales bacterium]
MNKPKNFDLEDRLIDFSIRVSGIIDKLPQDRFVNHLSSQLLRSSTSVALNYGEAQGAESLKDFIHKMRVVLKELKESKVCLKLILKKSIYDSSSELENTINESKELIAIFIKSVETAERNKNNKLKF